MWMGLSIRAVWWAFIAAYIQYPFHILGHCILMGTDQVHCRDSFLITHRSAFCQSRRFSSVLDHSSTDRGEAVQVSATDPGLGFD